MCIPSKKNENLISQDYLKSLFDYQDGNLIRKVARNNRDKLGQVAGSKEKNGYIVVKIDGKTYKAHRLIWLWHHGKFPDGVVDHKNRDRADNRIENLRDISQSENSKHQKIYSHNTSGVNGVHWASHVNKWCARIRINNKLLHLGLFTNQEDAIKARKTAELKYNFSPFHGNTSPLPNVVNL